MTTTNPTILGPDGVYHTEVFFTTTSSERFFEGEVSPIAVEMQVSIDGGGYTSDPSLVFFADGKWVVPNPTYNPTGLALSNGVNDIRVRAILPSGSTTPTAHAEVTVVSSNTDTLVEAPTNIYLSQNNDSVTIYSEPSVTSSFVGLNFYASAYAGGGSTGYIRVNVNAISEGAITEETESFATVLGDMEVSVDENDDPVADPMFLRIVATQEDSNETILATSYNTTFEIPETTRKMQFSGTLSSIRQVTLYSFEHNRRNSPTSLPATVRVSAFTALDPTTSLYYVVSAVYYDSATTTEYESAYSPEVVGHPLSVTSTISSLPVASNRDILQSFITAIFRSNPQIKVEPGSVLRDTVIDPFASESERIRFLLDFFNRARTPTLLLQIDDPTNANVSVGVPSSPYKQALMQALYVKSEVTLQSVIDAAFDAYGSNFGIKRKSGVAAVGEVTFFTSRKPTATIVFPIGTIVGGGSVQFSVTKAGTIPLSQLASFYDPITQRYSITLPVVSSATGSTGNMGAGQVKSIVSSIAGSFSVTNQGAFFGGTDRESNLALTIRIQNALASVDSGTVQGYLQTAADVPGVVKANVVGAGDPLMQRDLDNKGIHHGGKVDVWVQGSSLATVSDTFAFSYVIAQDIQFQTVGDVADLTFMAVDPELSSSNPIVEMLDDAVAGYELRNVTTGEVFDLTGVTYSSYNTITLSTEVDQPEVSLTDVVLGSYRRRKGNVFVLLRQPVSAITSVTGTVAGALTSTSTILIHPNAPLRRGRSALAGDYLSIVSYTDEAGNTVPSGTPLAVSGEEHTMVGSYPVYLDNLGANFLTIKVYNSDRSVEYKGPNDPSGDPDYTIDLGSETVAVALTRTTTGDIASGSVIVVDYEHDENFTVIYTTNLIVSTTQNTVDVDKHATADVLVKEAFDVPVDLDTTIILSKGADKATVDTDLRTNLDNFFANLRLGDPVRQSDVINVMENVSNISYVVVPLTKMVRQDGVTVVRDPVSTDTAAESTLVTSLSTTISVVYLLTNPLSAATVDGGGSTGAFIGVFQNDKALGVLTASSSLGSLALDSGSAYIIGSGGRAIDGVSDDATLRAAGYITDAAIEARRLELTANHVLVSLSIGEAPTDYAYAVTYVVSGATGANNIDPGGAEYLSFGNTTFTYTSE